MLPPVPLLWSPISLNKEPRPLSLSILPVTTTPTTHLLPVMLGSTVHLEDPKLVPPQNLPVCCSLCLEHLSPSISMTGFLCLSHVRANIPPLGSLARAAFLPHPWPSPALFPHSTELHHNYLAGSFSYLCINCSPLKNGCFLQAWV